MDGKRVLITRLKMELYDRNWAWLLSWHGGYEQIWRITGQHPGTFDAYLFYYFDCAPEPHEQYIEFWIFLIDIFALNRKRWRKYGKEFMKRLFVQHTQTKEKGGMKKLALSEGWSCPE